MGDGWTGINIGSVVKELDTFKGRMKEILTNYTDAFDLFNDELYRLWASENAVSFNDYIYKMAWIKYSIDYTGNDILVSAANAAKIMAQHNGASLTYDARRYMYSMGPHYKKLVDSQNGIRGMNIPMAKYSLDTFLESVSNVINMLNDLPMNFSLLDPNGELLTQYQSMVKKLIESIQSRIEESKSKLNEAFETEQLKVTMGKEQAEQTLAG